MTRKLFAALLFALGSIALLNSSAGAVEEAPAPRPVGDKAAGDKKAEGRGKFGGFGGKLDPEQLQKLKEKFGKDGGFGGFGGKGNFDPAKFKEMMKGKFGKDGGFGGKGGFPGGKGGFGPGGFGKGGSGGFGKKKDGGKDE